MKKLFLIPVLLILSQIVFAQSDTAALIFDEPYNVELPRNFRRSDMGFVRNYTVMPDSTGLSSLHISGSAEFNDLNLPVILKDVNHFPFIDIDLRQETHGFVNGMSVSWYGKYDWADTALSREQVIALEKRKLDSLYKTRIIKVTHVLQKNKADDTFEKIRDTTFTVISAMTEEELAKKNEISYFRITATDHRQPTVQDVDLFIDYITRIENEPWIHFHCHAGDGRTTTFMVMFDMMHNAARVSFEDIVARQYLIGGIDLTKDDDFPSWDKLYAIERTAFLKDFYNYCKSNADNYKTKYSDWLRK